MSKVTISPENQQKMLSLFEDANFDSTNIEIIDYMFTDCKKLFMFFDLKTNNKESLEDCTVLELSESSVDHLVNLMWFDDSKDGFDWMKDISSSPALSELTQLRQQLKYIQGYVFMQIRSVRRVA